MGKRSNKYRKGKQGSTGTKKIKSEWNCTTIPDDHPLFRSYYQNQLHLQQKDFNQFWQAMKQKLPVVFRVNPNCPNYQHYCNKINNQHFIQNIIGNFNNIQTMKQQHNDKQQNKLQSNKQQQNKLQQIQLPKLKLIPWYPPGTIVYEVNTSKKTLKKTKYLSQFHKYLQKSFDSGLISRQQLVSMLPPLYLDIQCNDIILDMCAAPGSKTSQILQFMYGTKRWLAKGCVIANDADYRRAQMLIHQLHRIGTTGMAVINHPGQFLPELYTNKVGSVKQKFQFDKILCDVPCSGDGATRKIPIKWLNWHTSDGMVLHPLQLSILMKGVNLLKKGGYLVYSTCSLNPLQNQAVINALFQKVQKGLQIIDIHPMFGVKGRKGLLSWKVYAIEDKIQQQEQKQKQKQNPQKQPNKPSPSFLKQKHLKQYKTYEQSKHISRIKNTFFPISQQYSKNINLHHTMRILPHDQNTGGFYVALLKKNYNFQWKYSDLQKKQILQQGLPDVQAQFLQHNLPKLDKPIAVQCGDEEHQNSHPCNDNDEDNDNCNQEQQSSEQVNEQILKEQKIALQIPEQQHKTQSQKHHQQPKTKKQKSSKYQTFTNISQQQFASIKNFYSIPDQLKKLLFVRSGSSENMCRKIILISQGVRKFIDADTNSKIKLVNMGCQVFQKGKQSFSGNDCLYRLCQTGIPFILQHIHSRKIKVPLQFFKKLLPLKSLKHEQIQDKQLYNKIKQITQGSFCIYINQIINQVNIIDALVAHNFKNSIHLLVSNQDQNSLIFRYL